MKRLVLAIVVLSVFSAAATGTVTGLLVKQSIDAAAGRQQHKLYLAQVAGCQRQNIRTAALNRNALANWRYDTFFAEAVTQPQPNQTRAQKALTRTFLVRLLETVATLTWTPLNRACVRTPTAVQLPITFSKRKPGKRDLTT